MPLSAVTDPRSTLGQVELEIDGDVFGAGGEAEADADLAVRRLSCRPRVLALHADGMAPCLRKPVSSRIQASTGSRSIMAVTAYFAATFRTAWSFHGAQLTKCRSRWRAASIFFGLRYTSAAIGSTLLRSALPSTSPIRW